MMQYDDKPASVYIYRLALRFWEHVFFASREVGEFFQTEPVLGNYALAYALGLAQSPYYVPILNKKQSVSYKRDLLPLNEQGIYVTPATLKGEPSFALTQFNAQTDTYWSVFAKNTIAVKYDDRLIEKDGSDWKIDGLKVRPSNYPQHGRIKMLARGNEAVAYLISHERLTVALPAYIRLGKFNSKVAVSVSQQRCEAEWRDNALVSVYLNAVDINTQTLTVYDLLSIHPAPLIRNAHLSGWFYKSTDGVMLPAHMRFGVEALP